MRELKFRAWYKSGKKMIYNIQNEFEERIELGMDCFSDYLKNDDFIVEQYTGLHDKNGKEIYEGDILKWKCYREIVEGGVEEIEIIEKIAKVYWEEGDASFVVGHWLRQLGRLVNEDKNEAEIIGNIHDNSELLERKK